MKTLVLSMISIAATVAAMTACTSESDEINNVVEAPTEIKMSAGILNIETRSDGPIDAVNKLTKDVDDVSFIKVDLGNNTTTDEAVDWVTDKTQHKATIAQSTGEIKFADPIPYYSSDQSKYSYLIGYHPESKGTLTDSKVSYTIDGNMDIMLSSVVKGNKDNKGTALTPEFSHKLTKLVVAVKGDAAAAAAWGTITHIKVNGVQKKVILDLSKKTLEAATTDNAAEALEITTTGYPTIKEASQDAGYCMILPKTSSDAYSITVETGVTSKNISVDIPESADKTRPKNTTLAGESYKITLTFKANEITATATIKGWNESAEGGSGDVD